MRRLVVCLATLSLVFSFASTRALATDPPGHVNATTTKAEWTGPTFVGGVYTSSDRGAKCFDTAGRPVSPTVITGNAACDVFTLFVDVPPSFWTGKAGGVAVRLDGFGANDIDLYIYKRNTDGTKGAFVTSSGAAIGIAENATIDAASGGYYIAAVAFSVSATDYQGHATLVVTAAHAPLPPVVTNPPGFPTYRASRDIYISHSEPHISMNPLDHNNLVAGSKQYVNLPSYQFKIGMYASFDGGKTWIDTGHLPGYPEATPTQCGSATPPPACSYTTSDIWTAFDDEGNAYAMVLVAPGGAAGTGWGMNLHRSSDGGRTWSAPIVIHNHNGGLLKDFFLDDKNAIAVDNYTRAGPVLGVPNLPGDKHIGTLYACWNLDDTTVGLHQDVVVTISSDGGNTWTQPIPVSVGQDLVIGCQFAIAPSGTAFVAWYRYDTTLATGNGQMYVSRSDNHGLTWSAPLPAVTEMHPIPSPFPGQHFRNLSVPAFGAGPDGSLYLTWADQRTPATGPSDADILFTKGTVGGTVWSAPRRVNQDALGNGKDQFQPQLAVTPSGQVNISYFDRRNDPDNFFIDVYLSRSEDGGATWADTRVTQKLWDPSINPPISGSGEFIGDYQGLVADDLNAIPFWNDTHLANLPTNDPNYSPWQEVFAARIPNAPDLTVTDITISDARAKEGELIDITATIANIGSRGTVTNVGVRYAMDGVTLGPDRVIPPLAAGASAKVVVTWATEGHPGSHAVVVTADPTNAIVESDETNNAGRATFFVREDKVLNPSFERTTTTPTGTRPTSWTPAGNVLWDNTGKYATAGIAAAGVVTGAVPGQGGAWISDAIAVVPGTWYDVSASIISGGTTSTPRILVTPLSAAGTALAPILSLTRLLPLGTIATLTGQVQMPAGVSAVVIELRDEVDTNTKVYFDKIGLFARD